MIMWLVMRGALSANVTETWRDYYLPSMTGIATLILENNARTPPVDTLSRHRQHMAQQLAGVEKLPTYPFTHERSLNSLRLNSFLHQLIQPAWRERFLKQPQALYAEAGAQRRGATSARRARLAWADSVTAPAFPAGEMGAVVGVSNLHIYAAMRGQTLEEFQKTRNQQVTYSVAGTR